MVKDGVLKAVHANLVKAKGKRPITSTWIMKTKSDGTYRARLVARGFQQVEGQHYDTTARSSPVTSDTAIWMVLTIMLVAKYEARVIDIKGAFLKGEFKNDEEIYMRVLEGFEKYYQITIHGYVLWSQSID